MSKAFDNVNRKRLKNLLVILTMLNRKQLPLCKKHHLEFEKGMFSKLDTDNLNSVLGNVLTPKNSDFKSIFDGDPYLLKE